MSDHYEREMLERVERLEELSGAVADMVVGLTREQYAQNVLSIEQESLGSDFLKGVNERHFHSQMHEIYMVAKGESVAVVNDEELILVAGDVLIIEPGEVHTFVDSSADYVHFVIHTPVVQGDKHVVA